jgi:hypothetical protein
VKIRLSGTPQECAATVAVRRGLLDVREVSGLSSTHRDADQVRVYLDMAGPTVDHLARHTATRLSMSTPAPARRSH